MIDNSNLVVIAAITSFFGLGMYFFMFYRRDRANARRLEEQRLKLDEERADRMEALEQERIKRSSEESARGAYERERLERRLYESQEAFLQSKKELDDQASAFNSGGYILLELPDHMRGMFTDLLRGFEEYAKLKGYNISFSVDNSLPNKIAFKFTIQESGISVSSQMVRKDIEEYIQKVRKGDSFDEMPTIISQAEHDLIATTLKNRVSFLQHSYDLEKNARSFYQKLLERVSGLNPGGSPSIFIQTGGVNAPKHLTASNSNQIYLAEEVLSEGNSTNADYSRVNIENSFNKKKEQIEKISELIKLIRAEQNIDESNRQSLVTSFDKIREEVEEEEQPNKLKIYKWLSKAKDVLETVVLAHHTTDAVKWIYESFNFLVK